jgi:hypothetical protein
MESWAVAHNFGSVQIKDHLIPILFDWTRKSTTYNDIDTIESDYHGNYQNIVFICLSTTVETEKIKIGFYLMSQF